jgi:hypothetical protein
VLNTGALILPESLNMLHKFLILLLTLTAAGCATHAAMSGRVVVRDDRAVAEVRFSSRDRTVIEEYYRAPRSKKAPPGLAKRETLPPGLARREALPPGLQGRLLPGELESRLSVLPGAYMRLVIGRDVVLMVRNTRVVLDILYGVAD